MGLMLAGAAAGLWLAGVVFAATLFRLWDDKVPALVVLLALLWQLVLLSLAFDGCCWAFAWLAEWLNPDVED